MGDLTFSLLGRAGKALFNKLVETEDSDIYEDEDTSYLYTKLFDMLKSDLLACDVQVRIIITVQSVANNDTLFFK